jgi:uncharacterized protein
MGNPTVMRKVLLLFILILFNSFLFAQVSNSMVVKDLEWDPKSPAGSAELQIPSAGSLLQGFIYKANGAQKHSTLILCHGYPGNERNLDLAQAVRSHGWNVIYFDYRGSWASQGQFSFQHCVEDVDNVRNYCLQHADSLHIDTSHIVLFGHSMGGWVVMKAAHDLSWVKKAFAVSTWQIDKTIMDATSKEDMVLKARSRASEYFVLNTPIGDMFAPVYENPKAFRLDLNPERYAGKQIIMIDEHNFNGYLAGIVKAAKPAYFNYEVWATDHPFTNKRVTLMNTVIAFLDKPW